MLSTWWWAHVPGWLYVQIKAWSKWIWIHPVKPWSLWELVSSQIRPIQPHVVQHCLSGHRRTLWKRPILIFAWCNSMLLDVRFTASNFHVIWPSGSKVTMKMVDLLACAAELVNLFATQQPRPQPYWECIWAWMDAQLNILGCSTFKEYHVAVRSPSSQEVAPKDDMQAYIRIHHVPSYANCGVKCGFPW
jgi:hypothetical protein